ncbi:helix-turn-helix domain-containing protein [Paenibacillus turpanensis]|uniref:helix-turn-helix domain-containing protein n=1 Tax=Paenibacillus turpanensis TaxID=2689078 RepID=UPI00140D0786|nr:AraC family transcriptional regulator [Paenibacillus turpanensis]
MHEVPVEAYELTTAFAKIHCEPLWKWPIREKPLETYDLFYVWSGQGEVTVAGTTYPVSKGTAFLFRPGDCPGASHDPAQPLTITYIHFRVAIEPASLPERVRVFGDPMDVESMLSRYVRTLHRGEFGAELEAKLLLKQLMILFMREDRAEHGKDRTALDNEDAVRDAVRYIRERPGIWHSAEELAKRARMSPRSFSMKFKEITGLSVQQYVITARLERAAHLLRYEGMNVSEAAEALGYKDVFFFSKQFKKGIGVNPSQYR